MKRKIFEQQIIDLETGVVTSVTQVTVSKFCETFIMGRTTDGMEWLNLFSGDEIKLLIILTEMQDIKTRIVHFTPVNRHYAEKMMSLKSNSLSKMIKRLEDKQALIRQSRTELILNPTYFYKGSSKEVLKNYNDFKLVYNSNYVTTGPCKMDATSTLDGSPIHKTLIE